MTKPSKKLSQELSGGTSLARFAEMTELSGTTIRNYESRGLIARPDSGRYGTEQFEQMERIKELKNSGLSLAEIVERLSLPKNKNAAAKTNKPPTETKPELSAEEIDALRIRLEKIRNKLLETKLRVNQIKGNQKTLRNKNELVLSKPELAKQEELKQQELQRALQVERKLSQLRYATIKPTFIKLDVKPKKR